MPACAALTRDGRPCRGRAGADGLCPAHARLAHLAPLAPSGESAAALADAALLRSMRVRLLRCAFSPAVASALTQVMTAERALIPRDQPARQRAGIVRAIGTRTGSP